jgi:hypothetical protein
MTERRGIALFAALSTMAVIALLVSGMMATSTLARRSSTLTDIDAELSAATDFAIVAALDSVPGNLPFGVPRAVDVVQSRVTTTVSMTRLPHDVLWLVAESRATGGIAARRRVNFVARWRVPLIPGAAIVSRGSVRLGSQVVFAADTSADAGCRGGAGPSVLLAPAATLTSVDSVLTRTDSAAADSATFLMNTAQRAVLDTTANVIHVRGDTTLYSGRVDGILLIDGRLTIAGNVTINGLVIARGAIDGRSGRLVLDGALLSYDPPATGRFAIELGEAVIRHSPCVIAREWRRILPLRPVNARSWAEIF